MMDAVANVRVAPGRGAKRKYCTYLCGAECWVTADPVDDSRKSIRWGNDTADPNDNNGRGTADWFCERAFIEYANETGKRDRTNYQAVLAKDHDKLTDHLSRRKAAIDRCKRRVLNPSSRGRPNSSQAVSGVVEPIQFEFSQTVPVRLPLACPPRFGGERREVTGRVPNCVSIAWPGALRLCGRSKGFAQASTRQFAAHWIANRCQGWAAVRPKRVSRVVLVAGRDGRLAQSLCLVVVLRLCFPVWFFTMYFDLGRCATVA